MNEKQRQIKKKTEKMAIAKETSQKRHEERLKEYEPPEEDVNDHFNKDDDDVESNETKQKDKKNKKRKRV